MFGSRMRKMSKSLLKRCNHTGRCAVAANAVMPLMVHLGRFCDELNRLLPEIDLAESSGDRIEHDIIVMLHICYIAPSGLADRIVWAWILTIPASGLVAAEFWWFGTKLF